MKRMVRDGRWRWRRRAVVLGALAAFACGGSGRGPQPEAGFAVLSGQTVLVLPVQYVQPSPGGWPGGAGNAQEAARRADREIAFALEEQGGRARWVTPDMLVEAVKRRPWIPVDPYALSAAEARRQGSNLRDIKDPLYGELRVLGALFDSRYAVWPFELAYDGGEEEGSGRLALRILLLDLRRGSALWYGVVHGPGAKAPASPAALALLAQEFALRVSP